MTSIREAFRNLFTPARPLQPGIYHYQAPQDDPRNYRLHLRIEADGSGILIVNAATVLHLNQTAAEYAYYLVQNLPAQEAGRRVASRYQVAQEVAIQDYQILADRIQTLINTPDLDPVTFLGFDRQEPFSGAISAPYRMDCALTYRVRDGDDPQAAPSDRVRHELSREEWMALMDRALQAGIPHLVFTGGEPTLRADLPELIEHAEANGQVTGLISDGLALADRAYLDRLLMTGLDHLMLVIETDGGPVWPALENALADDLFVAAHLTLRPENLPAVLRRMDRLAEKGVHAVSLSMADPALAGDLQAARDYADSHNLELVWNLPVPYSALHPVALELAHLEHPAGAGRAWIYVEPDGDVLPAQGINKPMGNLLNDPWEKIWKKTSG